MAAGAVARDSRKCVSSAALPERKRSRSSATEARGDGSPIGDGRADTGAVRPS